MIPDTEVILCYCYVFVTLLLRAVEPELKQLLVGCKSDQEKKQIVSAYLREAKGTDQLTDRVLLARKRKETGAKVRYLPNIGHVNNISTMRY